MVYRILLALLATPFLMSGAFCVLMFFGFYWSHRDCFNSEGRCYVPEDGVVYHDTSMFWALPASVLLLIGLALLVGTFWRLKKPYLRE
jgi:hypothetical protein